MTKEPALSLSKGANTVTPDCDPEAISRSSCEVQKVEAGPRIAVRGDDLHSPDRLSQVGTLLDSGRPRPLPLYLRPVQPPAR